MLVSLLQYSSDANQFIYYLFVMLFALTFSFSIHEFMHAYVATWLGDPTPEAMGRVTLNPLAHIDPMGTLLLLVAGFGWGKPVMFNPRNLNRFKNKSAMRIMVSLAGVTGNFILALFCNTVAVIVFGLAGRSNVAANTVIDVMSFTCSFSLMLLAFNLIPLPPLDGYHVLDELIPVKYKYTKGYKAFQDIAPKALFFIFVIGMVTRISVFSFLITIIEWPFATFIYFIGDLISRLF